MILSLFSRKCACEWTLRFSQQYTNHCLHYVFLIVVYQVPRNCLGTSKCHDHNNLTLHQPIRLQHFERGNENEISTQSKNVHKELDLPDGGERVQNSSRFCISYLHINFTTAREKESSESYFLSPP